MSIDQMIVEQQAGLTRGEYLLLSWMNTENGGKLYALLNRRGACGLTVCPECRLDDFVHFEGCTIGNVTRGDAACAAAGKKPPRYKTRRRRRG